MPPSEAQRLLDACSDKVRPAKNRRQLAKERSLAKLKTEGRFLFENVGYFGVGIRDIAERMGMSTGAVFSHVSDKASLWRLVMDGPPPSEQLAEEVALVEALHPGWGWNMRKIGGQYIASLTSPDFHLSTHGGLSVTGKGDSPASALREARIAADRKAEAGQ